MTANKARIKMIMRRRRRRRRRRRKRRLAYKGHKVVSKV